MKNKILAVALVLFTTCSHHAYNMSLWDDVDEIFRQQKNNFKEYFKQFEWTTVLRRVTENKNTNQLEFEFNFAGFDKDEISVSINDGILKLNAEKKKSEEKVDEDKNSNKKCIFKVKESAKKAMAFDLKKYNVNLDEPEKIESSYKNGILTVKIPLKKDSQDEIKISIKEDGEEKDQTEKKDFYEK